MNKYIKNILKISVLFFLIFSFSVANAAKVEIDYTKYRDVDS
jgi:hypothetical protein